MTKYQELQVKVKAMRAEMREAFGEAIRDGATELFNKYPFLTAFGCTCYTPYFNDGDTCTYSVNSDYPLVTFNFPGLPGEDNDSGYFDDSNPNKDVAKAAYDDVRTFLGSFDTEDFQSFFGDHIQFVVTRDGVEVEAYEHD